MRYPSSSSASSRGNNHTTPCCSKVGLKRGPWTPEEDELLSNYVKNEGEGRWRMLPQRAGLLRCGKSCRLRWMNYLRPSVKRGPIAPDEEDLILRLHRLLGNRWALIAGRIPGRTDNEIKNYWHTHLSKKLINQGIDPRTHKPLILNPNPNLNPSSSRTLVLVNNTSISTNPNPSSSGLEIERGYCSSRKFSDQLGLAHDHQHQSRNIPVLVNTVDNSNEKIGWKDYDRLQCYYSGRNEQVNASLNVDDHNDQCSNINIVDDTFSSLLNSLLNDEDDLLTMNQQLYEQQLQQQQTSLIITSSMPQALHQHGKEAALASTMTAPAAATAASVNEQDGFGNLLGFTLE